MRLCSMRSIATAAKASRRSRWSTSTSTRAVRRWSGWSRAPGAGLNPMQSKLSGAFTGARGEGSHRKRRNNPMHLHMHQALRCRARTRRGSPCQSPAMKNGRCRMHGGPSPGAPKGNQNALKHGRYTAQAMERRRGIATVLRAARALAHPDRADGRNANSHTQTGKGTKVICAQCGRPGGNQVASGDEIGPVWLHHECEASWIERRMGEEGIKLRQPDSPEK